MSIYSRYEAQTERAYHEQQESEALGQAIATCAKAIFEAHGAETMAQLQRNLYKYIECGPAISFALHDCGAFVSGDEPPHYNPQFIYKGDKRAETIAEPWNAIRAIGVSSIVEGSDAEIPLQWLDLERFVQNEEIEGELGDAAVSAFSRIVEDVNDEACALWHEAND